MKKITLALFNVFVFFNLNSQLTGHTLNDEELSKIKENKTIVLKSGNQEFDNALEKALKDCWKLTEYEFKFVNKDVKLKKGFNYLMIIQIGNISTQAYHYFGLVKGNDQYLNNYLYEDMEAYCQLDYFGFENPMTKSFDRLPLLLFNIQNAIQISIDNKFNAKTPLSLANNFRDFYNKNACNIKNKTLLVNQDREKQLTKEEFEKNYPYPIEFCNKEKIVKALNDRDPNYVIFFPTITRNKSIYVFDANTYFPLFFKYQLMGLKITKDDVEDLVKEINRTEDCQEIIPIPSSIPEGNN